MMEIIFLAVGIAIGASACWLMTRSPAELSVREAIDGVKWEKTGANGAYPALTALRRHYPTHDFITGIPFLDIVTARGTIGERATKLCRSWTISIIMIDKRTQEVSRLFIRSDDPDAEEKRWILRRIGFKVVMIEPEADDDGMRLAMAA